MAVEINVAVLARREATRVALVEDTCGVVPQSGQAAGRWIGMTRSACWSVRAFRPCPRCPALAPPLRD